MSASLVGSEMCIRDRLVCRYTLGAGRAEREHGSESWPKSPGGSASALFLERSADLMVIMAALPSGSCFLWSFGEPPLARG
eukprot:6957024-Alexandrium_andersonii.AAC.1